MKINVKKGQNISIQVRAPRSGEIFNLLLEPTFQDEMPLMPKEGLGAVTAVGDVQSYTNWEAEASKEQARIAIRLAAEKLRNPGNYTRFDAYTNISNIEDGIGASSGGKTVEELKRKRLG